MKPKSILLVDDVYENLYLLKVILEEEGYQILEAEDGKQGLEVLANNTVDLIITDILMPVMDGYMFCRACKKDDTLKDIPFIFYTSTYTEQLDEELALKMGAAQFLRKPTDSDKIVSIIKKILDGTLPNGISSIEKLKTSEEEALRIYSKRLISKLEQKNISLEKEVLERQRAEQLLINKNQILDAITSNIPLKEIFDQILLNYEAFHPGYYGTISMPDEDGKILKLISAPSMPKAYNKAVAKITIEDNVGSCGTAAFLKKPVIVSDISTDRRWVNYKDVALKHKFNSCWSVPILSKENKLLGTYGIYSNVINTPSLEEIKALDFAVSLANIAIEKYKILEEVKTKDDNYKTIIDQANDAILTYDVDGTIYSFNKAAYKNLGYTKKEFEKLKINDLVIGEVFKDPKIVNKLKKGKPVIVTKSFRHKDGSIVEAEISAKLQQDGKLLGIVRDITERQNYLKAIKKEKEFSTSLLDSMNEGLITIDLDSKIIRVNPAFCKMTGYTEQELLGVKRPYPFLDPELSELNDKRYKLLTENKNNSEYESVYLHKNGNRFPVQILLSEIYNEQGKKVANFATVQDISQRKKAENDLIIAKEFNDKLIMSMQEGLFILELDGTIMMVNESVCNMLGYSKDELVGMGMPYPFAKPEDFEQIKETHKKGAVGEVPPFQLEFTRKNGETFLASFLKGNIKNDNGNIIALFGTMKDISEEEKAKKILEDNAKKSKEKKDVILKLTNLVGQGFKDTLPIITKLTATTLNIGRVSIWSFNDDKTELYCQKLYDKESDTCTKGLVLKTSDNPKYFKALEQNKTIIVNDAQNNIITKDSADSYLIPFNITSLMDIFINSTNGYYGILSLEHVYTEKTWTADEQEFATSIASIVSLMVESNERKAAEIELKLEKDFSEELITSLYDGLSVVDTNGVHIKVNPALCKMTGFTEQELLGIEPPFPYWPPEEHKKLLKAFNNPSYNKETSEHYTFMRKNKERFPVALNSALIKNKKDEIIGSFATINDITARVKAENNLKDNMLKSDERKNIILDLVKLIGEDLETSLNKIVCAAAKTMEVALVTIWEYTEENTILNSRLHYNNLEGNYESSKLTIKQKEYPEYFNALENNTSLNIPNVLTDPITKDFTKQYFAINNVLSRIDVVIHGRNSNYGVISFECLRANRNFTSEEERFAISIASIVSLMIESSERQKAEKEIVTANEKLSKANVELQSLRSQLERENVYLRKEIDLVFNFEEMVYGSVEFSNVLTEIEKVASTNATVLLLGESGTGKELLARAVHNIGARNEKPLIKVNCSAIPRELIESELFGHKKGSFTGAYSDKIGKFELANNGTLFLDEIGELPLDMQPKILRFLQEGEIEVVGGLGTKKLDVRVIAATNRDLKEEIKHKRFREDLYFRLNVFPVEVPPLRNRKDDIPLLVEHFVDKFNKAYGKQIKFIADESMQKLKDYNWPGNIRELENLIERASILSNTETLVIPGFESTNQKSKVITDKDLSLNAVQRNHIIEVLERCNWKISGQSGAAHILDLKPSTLRDRMQKLGIKKPK